MNVLKRILLFAACFVVIYLVAALLMGAVAGGLAVRDIGPGANPHDVGRMAGAEMGRRYSWLITLGSIWAAAAIAFRWWGAAAAGVLVACIFFFGLPMMPKPEVMRADLARLAALRESAASPNPAPSNSAASDVAPAPARTSSEGAPGLPVGRRMVLAAPLTVNTRYGSIVLPPGSTVQVVSDRGAMVQVSTMDGDGATVLREDLR